MIEERLIQRALKLAQKGAGRVSPNPMVGAVIVQDSNIIAEGYHRFYGAKHAEVDAIDKAKVDIDGSVLYVNLEPCSHSGKQPPCVDRILAAGIKKVVIGTPDPNPLVNGRGIKILRDNGIEVISGVLADECYRLNEAFFKYIREKLPFVTLKIAQSLDGRIAAEDGSSKWITSEKSRKLVHRMRFHSDVILVGIDTIITDNPGLDVRLQKGKSPVRIILDSKLRIPLGSKILNDAMASKTIIATKENYPENKAKAITQKGAQLWPIPLSDHEINLLELLKKIAEKNYSSILVEGGSKVFSSFIKNRLADRIALFVAPKILGSGLPSIRDIGIRNINDSLQLKDVEFKKVGCDYLYSGLVLNQ